MSIDQNFELSPLQVYSLKSELRKKRGRPMKHRDTDLCPCRVCCAMRESHPLAKTRQHDHLRRRHHPGD